MSRRCASSLPWYVVIRCFMCFIIWLLTPLLVCFVTQWNDALGTLDPRAVAARYTKDAVLLPTVSGMWYWASHIHFPSTAFFSYFFVCVDISLKDIPRDTPQKIEDYFVAFCKLRPQGTILESFVQIGPKWCKDSGIYEFEMGATGETVKARYTFIYKYEDGQWKIAHHHSSAMPEGMMAAASKIKEVEAILGR
jgi:hypothetical protein